MRVLVLRVRQTQRRAANLLNPDLRCRSVLPAVRNVGDQPCVRRECRPAGHGRGPSHSLEMWRARRVSVLLRGRGGKREPPTLPPGDKFLPPGVDAAALLVGEAMHGQTLIPLPSLYGSDTAAEIGGNLFPGVEPPLD